MIRRMAVLFLFLLMSGLAQAKWDEAWTGHAKISIDTRGLSTAVEQPTVVVRLHSGNFSFPDAKLDGSDLRFIAADEKTELKYHIEKFDSLNELAVIWVQLPKLNPADKDAHIWLYYGNEKAVVASNPKTSWDAATVVAFHFAEKSLLQDSSPSGLAASGEITVQKAALLGEAAVFASKPLLIPANPALKAGAAYSWSAWIKPASLPQQAKLYSQGDVVLKLDGQKLSLSVGASNVAGGEIKPTAWQHVAFTLDNGKAFIYINGAEVANGTAAATDAQADIKIGDGYSGELDELEIANVARNAEWIKLAALSQGPDSALLKVEAAEGDAGSEEGESSSYISILVNSLTVDAKVVIAILGVMFAISVWVMVQKARLVSRTDKDNAHFLQQFQKAGQDLLMLDKASQHPHSTLYKLYEAGLREIRKRQHANEELVLSGASIDAIKAAIDADLVRETQRQNSGMVLLTIAISGGPFLGLLGTVVGVMITFAAIAAAGDVNVNAIAPGIAAALLATVAGLGVAIPALFGYNYLASRIKNITIAMQIFVDEFVTRVAELYGR